MSFKHDRTRYTLIWLDFYGLCREACMNPFATQEFMDGGSEAVGGVMSDIETAAGAQDAKNQVITDRTGDALMGVGAGIVAIAGETVVGAIVGIVIAACGAIVKYLARLFYVECDKYHCQGFDRKTRTEKRVYKEHQQAVVGVDIIKAKRADTEHDCSCKLRSHECTLVRYMHDGLMVEGIDFKATENTPTRTGRVRGANAIASGGNSGCVEYWRKNPKAMPLDERGNPLPVGDPRKESDNPKDSYYYRAWRVRNLLLWMQEKMLCRTMECMEDVIKNTTEVEGDSAFNQKRRRGSRWYSSIVWMMRDIWEYGEKIEKTNPGRLSQIATKAGANQEALKALKDIKSGKVYKESELPWIWWPFLKHFSFWQLRKMLIDMKDEFPYEPRVSIVCGAKGMPQGAEARKRSVVTKPMVSAITTAVKFTPKMQPIPAKIGSRGPGWGILAFGGIAALIGGYTIYKVVSEKEE